MKWNVKTIYVVKLKVVIINLGEIWYVQAPTYGTSAHQILSRLETKMFFPVFHIYCGIDHGHYEVCKINLFRAG